MLITFTTFFFKIPPYGNHVIFVTEFVILGTILNFYEVNIRGSENVFPHEGNSKKNHGEFYKHK